MTTLSFVPLPLPVSPMQGESLLGLLLRTCWTNGVSSRQFASSVPGGRGREFAALAVDGQFALGISSLTKVDRATIASMMHLPSAGNLTFFGSDAPAKYVERAKMRFAPGRLASGRPPFHRHLWSLRFLDCDPTTGELLQEHVACCGTATWWQLIGRGFTCKNCGVRICDAEKSIGSDEQIRHARFWASLYSQKSGRADEARRALHPDIAESPIRL